MSPRAHDTRSSPVRMLDVAAAAGVSRSTVSNVLRGLPTVADSVRENVLRHADALGYVYNRGAAGLRMSASNLVGLLVPHIANPFIAEALRGAHAVFSEFGYLVTTVESDEDLARQRGALRTLTEHQVDGLLVMPAIGTAPSDLAGMLRHLPAVILNREASIGGADFVGLEDADIARIAADHLLRDHHCEAVGYFGGPQHASPRERRADVFVEQADSAGAELIEPWSSPCEPTAQAAHDLARQLLDSFPPPDGLFCHSDEVAYGVTRAFHDAGVSPARCRVIGCDDLPDSSFHAPSITSIAVAPGALGRVAAQHLLLRLGHDIEPERVPTPTLIARESCGCRPA